MFVLLQENTDQHYLDCQSLLVGVLVAVISVLLLTVGAFCIGTKGHSFCTFLLFATHFPHLGRRCGCKVMTAIKKRVVLLLFPKSGGE